MDAIRSTADLRPVTMERAGRWQMYVVAYTFFFGAPLLLVPDRITPMLGFAPSPGPWVRLVGMLLLGFCAFSWALFRYREGTAPFVRASMAIRFFFAIVLAILGLAGHPPFLLLMSGIVLVGVIGSFVAYRADMRRKAVEISRSMLK